MAFDFACPDWQDRLAAGRPPMPDLPFGDTAAAQKAVAIFNNLRLPDVGGQPRLEEACGEWFRDIVRAAFGSAGPDGESQVGEIFCLVPKKNAKTTNSAALGITALLMNKTPRAEMLIVAPTKDVADTCFSQAAGMIEADDEDPDTGRRHLVDRFHIAHHQKKITCRVTGATLEVKAFSMDVVTGTIPALCIVDELHLLGASRNAARVLAQIRGGMITKPNTLLLFITTQSDEPPAGAFKAELTYARRVRDGALDPETAALNRTLPILYELPEALQSDPARPWADPKHWPMVLPNLGRSITIPRLLRLYRGAVEKGDAEVLRWASQHLNLQLGMGKHDGAWIGADYWPACATPGLTLDRILETSDVVCAGIDGGGLDDLLGLGVVGRHAETRAWQAWGRAWAQTDVLERRQDIASRLEDFAAEGDLVICEDATQDLREVAAILKRIHAAGLFPEAHGIGLDPYGVAALVDELSGVGLEGDLLAAIGQGTRLSPAVWGAERKLKDRTLVHGGQPMLSWVVSNARTEQRGNAVLITKAVSGKAKIDPLIGIFNAVSLMSRNPVAAGTGPTSPWDDPAFRLRR